MLAPYRSLPLEEPLPPPQPWLVRAKTRVRRKMLVWWKGTFKKRYPLKCPVCSKPACIPPIPWATGYELSFSETYSPCGHKHGVFERMREQALKPRRVQTHGGGPR